MSWTELMKPDKSHEDLRREEQRGWAARRQEHLAEPNPGLIDALRRKAGNLVSNYSLARAEGRAQGWDQYDPETTGALITDSPTDAKRFSVYDAMLKARAANQKPDPEIQRQWQIILRGEVPK
jgi:hypothetical protein